MYNSDHINNLLTEKGLTVNGLENLIGVGQGSIGKKMRKGEPLTNSVIEKIIEKFPNMSEGWLRTGQGEMLTKTYAEAIDGKSVNEPASVYETDFMKLMKENKKLMEARIADLEEQNDLRKKLTALLEARLADEMHKNTNLNGLPEKIQDIEAILEAHRVYILKLATDTLPNASSQAQEALLYNLMRDQLQVKKSKGSLVSSGK